MSFESVTISPCNYSLWILSPNLSECPESLFGKLIWDYLSLCLCFEEINVWYFNNIHNTEIVCISRAI